MGLFSFPSGGRGGAVGQFSVVDAPSGPKNRRNKEKNEQQGTLPNGSALSSVNSITASKKKEDDSKRTLTDFKIVGLELPELSWKWGFVPEKEREEEGKKRKAELGSEGGGEYFFRLRL